LRSRLHRAVIRVYDEAGNVIETHEHASGFTEPQAFWLPRNFFCMRSLGVNPISFGLTTTLDP
jgi:hypothetical protein